MPPPEDFVEVTVTFLVPVTDENANEVDGLLVDMIEAHWQGQWFRERLTHFVKDQGMVLRMEFIRPWERWKAPRRKANPR